MSLIRYLRLGLRPHLHVPSEFCLIKRFLEVKCPPCYSSQFLRNQSTNNGSCNDTKEIVYVGPLTRQIRSVKIFSLLSSCSGIFAQPVIYEKAQQIGTSTPMLIGVCSVVGFFTFVTPFLLNFITKKYVTSIEYNISNDTYTAIIYTFFIRKKQISFKPGEAVVPDILGMFTSMTVRGTPLFIDSRFFEDLTHYKKIMGYDKPIDFKIDCPNKQNITNSQN